MRNGGAARIPGCALLLSAGRFSIARLRFLFTSALLKGMLWAVHFDFSSEGGAAEARDRRSGRLLWVVEALGIERRAAGSGRSADETEAFRRIMAENASFPNVRRRFWVLEVVETNVCNRLLQKRMRSLQSQEMSGV